MTRLPLILIMTYFICLQGCRVSSMEQLTRDVLLNNGNSTTDGQLDMVTKKRTQNKILASEHGFNVEENEHRRLYDYIYLSVFISVPIVAVFVLMYCNKDSEMTSHPKEDKIIQKIVHMLRNLVRKDERVYTVV
uniref:Uncharacterized protein n=1 Tax=Arion vulgaris TaxID=1028688 RepID=A0A0B7ABV2_9EUPU